MLTDYHVHLRPDEDGTPASRYFTPGNAERYRAVAAEQGIEELGVAEHVHRFTAALDVWQHPFWRREARDDLDDYVAFVREETDLRLGIEADFVPGREDRMATLLEQHEWDYIVGSVHFVGDYAVDWDDEDVDIWRREPTPERVWRRYFDALRASALSGLFDIIAHPDLVKIWGPPPSGRPLPDTDLRRYYEPAVEAMLDAGVAMEVSTAGLRKPVREIYPARAMLEMAVDAGLPIALSSDAHLPAQIGYGYDQAVALLSDCGVREVCVFERRVRRLEPLG
jgi:histidinol-phosphatase (PHP family)